MSDSELYGGGKTARRYPDLIGQEDFVTKLKNFGDYFISRGGTPGHILVVGDESMGKETIAIAFANELDVGFQQIDAAKLEVNGDLSAILTNLRQGQILFISNIQSLRKVHLDRLPNVLRNHKLEIIIGQGPRARTHVMDINPFTLIATCPRKSDCPRELLGEFALTLSMQPYSLPALEAISQNIAKKMGVSLERTAAALVARHCDGCPGGLQSLLQRLVRAINKPVINEDEVLQAFSAFGMRLRPDMWTTDVSNIKDLPGIDFEKMIANLLGRMGFSTEMTKVSGDGGIDIVATLDKPIVGGRYLFQCKRFAPDSLIGAPTLRDFYGAVTADRAVKGVFVTTSNFTAQARDFGERVGLELIDLQQLQKLFLEYGLLKLQG